MPIKTLIHNLKLLGFDESKHGKRAIKLNEKLFTHGAINNDKALEYICLFLFRKLDKLRVKKELLPSLAIHTYANRQQFIAHVYKWLIEIRQKTHLFHGIPLRKSELSAYQGANLIKNMVALSTYILESTVKHTDDGKIPVMPKAVIQNNILQANQTFDLNTESSNTYVGKAAQAAKEISTELSSLPPPPPASSKTPIQVKSQSIRRLNDHLQFIIDDLPPTVASNPVHQELNIVEEPFVSTFHERTNSVQRSSSSLSFESLRALEESSTSFMAERLRTVEEPSSPVIPEDSEEVNEPLPTEKSPTLVILDQREPMNALSSTLLTERSTYTKEPASSLHVEELSTVVTSSDTSVLYAAAPNVTAGKPIFNSTTTRLSSPEVGSTEPEVPTIDSSKTNPTINIYMPEGSRMITTPNYIPRSFTPDDEQWDVPDASRKIAQPRPRATMPNTTSTPQNTSFTPRSAIHYSSSLHVLPPLQFHYTAESNQLPPLRHVLLAYSGNRFLDSPYWHVPAISYTSAIQPTSPRTPSPSPPSPSAAPKRKIDEQEDSIVVPLSPPRHRRKLTCGSYEGGTTPTTVYDMELVPPLMEEPAPFRRIYNTEFFDIDLMTPRR